MNQNGVYLFFRAIARELKTLVMVGPKLALYKVLGSRTDWQKVLPVQVHTVVPETAPEMFADLPALARWLTGGETRLAEGYESLYLPPAAWSRSPLAPLAVRYPENCGLKIAKRPGGVEQRYNGVAPGRTAQSSFGYSHDKQLLTFNVFHLHGVAARLYDLVEFTDGAGNKRVAYVVEHVDGTVPEPGPFEEAMQRLKALKKDGVAHLVSGGGWEGVDFQPPDCNGNLIQDSSGRALYVDVHNFVLGRYDVHLERLARSVSEASHFGNRSILLGGRGGGYLYQEIPGVGLPAKRSPVERMRTYDRLFARAGVEIRGKAVLDVGCNLGLMGAEYLRRGAAWLHGWDMPAVVPASERVLLSIGCTRFSLTPTLLSPDVALDEQLPAHVAAFGGDDVVLSYLAIRGHVGWLPALARLNWRYMVYEGHQNDGPLEEYVHELNKLMPVRIAAADTVSDSNSFTRTAAIIERLPA